MLGCSRGEDEWGAKLRGSLKTIGNTKKNQVFEYDCSTRPSGRVRIETCKGTGWVEEVKRSTRPSGRVRIETNQKPTSGEPTSVAPDLRVG